MRDFERCRERLDDRLSRPLANGESAREERDVLAAFWATLQSDDVVWDVGAGDGRFTLLALEAVGSEWVAAFEVDPDAATALRERCADAGYPDVRRPSVWLAGDDETDEHRRADGDRWRALTPRETLEYGYAPPPTVVRLDARGREQALLERLQPALGFTALRRIVLPIYDDAVRRWLLEEGYAVREVAGPRATSGPDQWTSYVVATPPWVDDAGAAGAEPDRDARDIPLIEHVPGADRLSERQRDRLARAVAHLRVASRLLGNLLALVTYGPLLPKLAMLAILAMFVPFALVVSEVATALGASESAAAVLAGFGSVLVWWVLLGVWFLRG